MLTYLLYNAMMLLPVVFVKLVDVVRIVRSVNNYTFCISRIIIGRTVLSNEME